MWVIVQDERVVGEVVCCITWMLLGSVTVEFVQLLLLEGMVAFSFLECRIRNLELPFLSLMMYSSLVVFLLKWW